MLPVRIYTRSKCSRQFCSQKKEVLDLDHYNRQFARCAILSNDKEALVCFKKMKEDGISPNVVTYNHMFKMFSKTRPQYVEALFVQMKAEGIEPDFPTYKILIEHFGQQGKKEASLLLFKDMKDKGLSPDEEIYSSLIRMSEVGPATLVFASMKKSGIPQTVLCYNALLYVMSLNNDMKALAFYKEMHDSNILPTIDTYHYLMKILANEKMVDEVLGLFHDIKAKGFVSNETTYHILIRLFLDINSISEAVLAIKEAEEKGLLLDKDLLSTVQESYEKMNNEQENLVNQIRENFNVSGNKE